MQSFQFIWPHVATIPKGKNGCTDDLLINNNLISSNYHYHYFNFIIIIIPYNEYLSWTQKWPVKHSKIDFLPLLMHDGGHGLI
jgi:hypothetical protein